MSLELHLKSNLFTSFIDKLFNTLILDYVLKKVHTAVQLQGRANYISVTLRAKRGKL